MRDWSWRRTRRRVGAAGAAHARRTRDAPRSRSGLLARVHARRARAALPRQARDRRGNRDRRPRPAHDDRRSLFLAAALAALALSAANTYLTGWTGERVLADLRNRLFRHLQRLSLGFYERNRAGVIISRITNDVEALDQLVTDGVTSLVQNTLLLGGTAVVLFLLDWKLALATLTVLPLDGARDRLVPQPLEPRLPERARAARPRHRDARRGHRGHARRPVVHARAGAAARVPRRQRPLPGRELRDGRPERDLLPGGRSTRVGGDRDRLRLRRLAGLPRRT